MNIFKKLLGGTDEHFVISDWFTTRHPFPFTANEIIEEEEQGTLALLESDLLPIDLGGRSRRELERLGFSFGNNFGLFVEAKLPSGWKKLITSHRNITIFDEDGAKVAYVFFKAASYDTKARMSWEG